MGAGAGEIGGAWTGAGVGGGASSFSQSDDLGRGWSRSNPARQPTTPATSAPARIAIRAMRSPRRLLVAWRVGTGWVAADGAPTDPPIPAAAPVPEAGPPRVSRPPSRPRSRRKNAAARLRRSLWVSTTVSSP